MSLQLVLICLPTFYDANLIKNPTPGTQHYDWMVQVM